MPAIATDTIVAPATAPGEAAVAIVRLSGPDSWLLASRLVPSFGPASPPRQAHFGHLSTSGGLEDDVLVLPFRGPRSYTGEDLVELHLHGNDLLVSGVVGALAALGARPAQPGEFTQRAFLNAKLDLAQAEAVAELIGAKSARAAQGAAARLAGSLSEKYSHIRRGLLDLMVHLEATIDFPDEDIETLGYPRLFREMDALLDELARLSATFQEGRLEQEGLRVAIAGRPNAGKSSLLNALLGTERAIVTAIPGTTRDYLEERLILAGAHVLLFDTAGLRETADPVEAEGIRRARTKLSEADILLYVLDSTAPVDPDELALARTLAPHQIAWVLNKCDLAPTPPPSLPPGPSFQVSALTGQGLDALRVFLAQQAAGSDTDSGVRVVSARQQRLIEAVQASLNQTKAALQARVAPELVVEDLKLAVKAAGELTGEVLNDEVLGEIFSRFCIGK